MKFRLRLLLVAFAVCFLLVAALSTVSVVRFSKLSARVSSVERSYQVANMINALSDKVLQLDKNEFRFLVTGDSGFSRDYESAAVHVKKTSDSLKILTAGNTTLQDYIVLFDSDIALYLAASQNSMDTRLSAGNIYTSAPYQNSKQLMDAAVSRLLQMAAVQNSLLKIRTAERESYEQLTSAMIKALNVVFGIVTLILFFLLLREFRRRVLYQAELQQKVTEIAQSKQELEHIAYATSHDLQEPLRKIRILIDKWQHQQKNNNIVSDNTQDTLSRIITAVTRMQDLVSELMILTTLNDGNRPVPCALREYAGSAVALQGALIAEKGARVEIAGLPVINGHPDQLKLLFKNLLDNALKFTRPNTAPVISITARVAVTDELGQGRQTYQKYHCITIMDNGVGFDNKIADKMFGIFRQLHTEKEGYTGKGTGLAICQRIMSNHKGRIIAHGFPDAGATFKLYFPMSDSDRY